MSYLAITVYKSIKFGKILKKFNIPRFSKVLHDI